METLPREELALFKSHLKLIRYKKRRELFQEGGFPKGVFIIKRGKVKLYQRMQNGSEQIVYIYTQGEMFGYRPLLSQGEHPASAMTLEDCSLYVLTSKTFIELLKILPSLSGILLRNLSHEFTVLINRIASFSQKSTKERIALSLLILHERYRKSANDNRVEITLSRADLAAYAGTTQETVARTLTKFKTEGIIKTQGRKIFLSKQKELIDIID